MRSIDISHKTIFFIAGFLALIWALILIKDVIILLFVAIIFMSALSPIVEFLVKFKIPKALAIAMTYLLIIGLIVGLFYVVLTPLAEQTKNLSASLPQIIAQISPTGLIDKSVLQQELGNVSKNALDITLNVFNNFIGFISIAVLTFYLLLDRDKVDGLIGHFFVGREERVKLIIRRIEDKLGAWMRGQLALSFIIGIMSYIALTLLGVPFAIPLSILAGIMEVVPVIGPIISSLPAILVAYVTSPFLAAMTALAFFVIQQTENHIVVPQVMRKAVGLNPLIVILAVAIGSRLLGVSGALLAVPITAVIQILTEGVLVEDKV